MLIYCAKCEAANSDQAPFCGGCGHPLMTLARPQVVAPPPPSRTPTVNVTLGRRFGPWSIVGWLVVFVLTGGIGGCALLSWSCLATIDDTFVGPDNAAILSATIAQTSGERSAAKPPSAPSLPIRTKVAPSSTEGFDTTAARRSEPCMSWGQSEAYLEKLERDYRYIMEVAGISMDDMLEGGLDACIDRVEEGDEAALKACRECVRAIIGSIYSEPGAAPRSRAANDIASEAATEIHKADDGVDLHGRVYLFSNSIMIVNYDPFAWRQVEIIMKSGVLGIYSTTRRVVRQNDSVRIPLVEFVSPFGTRFDPQARAVSKAVITADIPDGKRGQLGTRF